MESLPLPTRAIPGVPDLMHHKYAVRDGASVLTGSTNWTLDSWERQENVILRVHDAGVAAAYRADFGDLWQRRDVDGSGAGPVESLDLTLPVHTFNGSVVVGDRSGLIERVATPGTRVRLRFAIATIGEVRQSSRR